MIKKCLSFLLITAAFTLRAFAADGSSVTSREVNPVAATIVVEDQSVQAGHPFWVGIHLDIKEGWDTYWINPGDAGLPTKVTWHLPEGFTAGELQWPAPSLFFSEGLAAIGYDHSTTLLAQITPPAHLSSSSIDIKADVSWLACKDGCVPGETELYLSLPASDQAPLKNESNIALFNEVRSLLPSQSDEKVTLTKESEKLTFNLGSMQVKEALFIPETGNLIDYHAPQQLKKGEDHSVLQANLSNPQNPLPNHVKGVLLVKDKDSAVQKAIMIDTAIQTAQTVSHSQFFGALFFAFLGGIILNVMPCVLPVIALKVMSFVKLAGEKKSEQMKHGGAFAFGVLLSFWVLTGVLLILRAMGQGIGWGFQLQEPLFVAILIAFLFLFGLSLFGLFEMGTSLISLEGKAQGRSPLVSAFLNGVLATVVATPCTGPFLGSALGFALTLPAISSFAIFTSMGLGMALPYLIFSFFPKLLRFLPKPGNWMDFFKQIIGFVMMGTVLWLLWVFASETSIAAVFILLGALLVISIAAWVFGKWGTPLVRKSLRRIAFVVSLALLAFSGMAIIKSTHMVGKDEKEAVVSGDKWQPFSLTQLETLRSQGKPVFVDFTAKWCLICQSNKVVLHSNDVIKAFDEKGVTMMSADWTKKSPAITEVLEKLGRSGVPLYVIYPADQTASPIILPQTLSKTVIMQYLDQLPQ